jgi:hypothetical protein
LKLPPQIGSVKRLQNLGRTIPTERGFAIPFQIEGFIAWILEIEPQANQLNFCLGYLNETFKHDPASAKRYYDQFLSLPCQEADSRKAIAHAKAFMKNVMNSNNR